MTYEIANQFYLAHQTAFMAWTLIAFVGAILGFLLIEGAAQRRANRKG